MKVLLSLVIFISGLNAFAQVAKVDKLCVVISGKNHDTNNFLDEELFKSGEKVAGVDCKVFGNWADAKKYAFVHLKPKGKLMMVQGAHGLSSGKFEVNDGPLPDAKKIYSDLKELSKIFHVGSVIHSCFSGAIMNEKLLDDELSNTSGDQLCLITSSSFGRITYSHSNDMIQNLLKLRPGENLEKPFINNPGGVISSAAWSDVNLPQFLMSKKTKEGFETLEKMDKIIQGGSCEPYYKTVSKVCVSSKITDKAYEDVRTYWQPIIDTSRIKEFQENYPRLIARLENESEKQPTNNLIKDEIICRKEILKDYQAKFGSEVESLGNYVEIMNLRDEIITKAYYTNHCMKYLWSVRDDEWKKNSLITSSFQTGLEDYLNDLKQLELRYPASKENGTFSIGKFLEDAVAEETCPSDARDGVIASKEKIIQSLFGLSFFSHDYNTGDQDSSAPNSDLNALLSTQRVLKGFQNSALLKSSLENPKDQQRRKACRDFKF